MTYIPENAADSHEMPVTGVAEKLLRRYTAPLGVIDVSHSQAHYLRLTAWLSDRFPLLEQIYSRRQLDDSTLAVPGVFVYREQPRMVAQFFNNTLTQDGDNNHTLKSPRASGYTSYRTKPSLPTAGAEKLTKIKASGSKLDKVNTMPIVDATGINEINYKSSNEVQDKNDIHTWLIQEHKLKEAQENPDDGSLPLSQEQQPVWRLRRPPLDAVTLSNRHEALQENEPRPFAVEQNRNFSAKEKLLEPTQLDTNKSSGEVTQTISTLTNNLEEALIGRHLKADRRQETVKQIPASDQNVSEQGDRFPVYSGEILITAPKMASEPSISKRVLKVQAAMPIQTKIIIKPALESVSEISTVAFTPGQAQTTLANPFVWQNTRASSNLPWPGKVNGIGDEGDGAYAHSNLSGSNVSSPGSIVSESSVVNAQKHHENQQNFKSKEIVTPEFEIASPRLSKRQWAQLVDRVSRVIWNRLILDLDRRGIRVWR
jgi:hypothetical protein